MPIKMLTLLEVAEILGTTRRTMYRWIEEGNFPQGIVLATGTVRWDAADVEAWIASKKSVGSEREAA